MLGGHEFLDPLELFPSRFVALPRRAVKPKVSKNVAIGRVEVGFVQQTQGDLGVGEALFGRPGSVVRTNFAVI